MEIKDNTIAVLDERMSADMKYKDELRIVRWTRNGRPGMPKLEKRAFIVQPNGTYLPGKQIGLTLDDINTIYKLHDKIVALMMNVSTKTQKVEMSGGEMVI